MPSRRLRLILLPIVALLVLALGLAFLAWWDANNQPVMDFEPNLEASALDRDGVPWASESGAEVSETPAGLEQGPEAEEPETVDPKTATEPVPPASCEGPRDGSMPTRWLMIGWDGADWQHILPLLEEGKLPHLEKLMRGGSYGTLASLVPTLSPAIWTTVATGTSPGEHGILHFYNQQPLLTRLWQRAVHFGELPRQLYTNADRRRHAIWNLADEQERTVMAVGYHNTFPVEPVDGLMVSNYLVQDSVAQAMEMDSGADESDLAASLVHPMDHLKKVLDIQKEVQNRTPEIVDRFADIPEDERDRFLRDSRRIDPDGDQKPYFLVHAWLFDEIVAQVADAFYADLQPDLGMVHFQGVDWASHRFLYYHAPELFTDMDWSAETRDEIDRHTSRYAATVEAFYVYLDEWLGRFEAQRGDDTAILLLSDHGFAAEADPHITGGHDHAPPGIVVLNGPGIRRDHQLQGATIYDVMPTLMAGLDLPVAEDLKGSVLDDAFCEAALAATPRQTVPTYHDGEPFVPEISRPSALDAELLQQMKSLGYIQ